MLRNLTAWHLIIVVGVLVLLFGANRLPDLAKGVGQSLKIFKNEVKELTDGAGDGSPAPAAAAGMPAAGTPAAAERTATPPAERAARPE